MPSHDRMPAILPPEDYEAWLSPDAPPEEAKALLRPYERAAIIDPVRRTVGPRRTTRRS